MSSEPESGSKNFLRTIVAEDLRSGKHSRVVTRFPPEPSGYLHIGHATTICLNFGIAGENPGGVCHLRFDDTNPVNEEVEYVESIQEDIRWLGFDWKEHLHYTSDYFARLYEFAVALIKDEKAFVCDLSSEEIFERRGTLTEPGTASPYRDRSRDENLELFRRMKDGEFETGSRSLRAKIDMGSSILPMRDPVIYRIQKEIGHHRTGTDWSIYPTYDMAHSLSDAIEGITHSLCSGEFYERRPLYNWFVENVDSPSTPRQIEFARVALTHTLLSKRKLRQLIEEGHVSGWDDPRMPTLSGLRRRGYTPQAIRHFCEEIGMTPGEGGRSRVIQLAVLEHAVREDLNANAPRVMGVIDPLRVVIENYPEENSEVFEAQNHPQDPSKGTRTVPFSRVLYIEREDFMEDPPKKFFRLAPGREVRLRYAYFITCVDVIKDGDRIVELRCTYDPETRGGDSPDGRKVKGTLHWVSAEHAIPAEVRLYDTLFANEDPAELTEGDDYAAALNPRSLQIADAAQVEPSLADAIAGTSVQFERLGYFCVDPDSQADSLVFNRTVSLRDNWAKSAPKGKK